MEIHNITLSGTIEVLVYVSALNATLRFHWLLYVSEASPRIWTVLVTPDPSSMHELGVWSRHLSKCPLPALDCTKRRYYCKLTNFSSQVPYHAVGMYFQQDAL